LNVLDLFSGIGGFSLGLERAGMRTVAFCEIGQFQRRVLEQHWPDVPILGDIQHADFPAADIITAGFPCQDISSAGNRTERTDLAGNRSGLFWEVIRAIRVVRPKFVLLENVAILLARGMGTVLGALAARGYDAEWDCVPAAAIGAPCIRDRVFIVAHAHGTGVLEECDLFPKAQFSAPRRRHANGLDLATDGPWSAMPAVCRVDYGLPGTMDRLSALGNAVVPQIPEIIGRAIMNRVAGTNITTTVGSK
jgi:DNA (cytosine-5)-methyltransferase 1